MLYYLRLISQAMEVIVDANMLGKTIDTAGRAGWYHDACIKHGTYVVGRYVLDCSAWVWTEYLRDRVKAVGWTDDRQPIVIDCRHNLGTLADACGDALGRTFSFYLHQIR